MGIAAESGVNCFIAVPGVSLGARVSQAPGERRAEISKVNADAAGRFRASSDSTARRRSIPTL